LEFAVVAVDDGSTDGTQEVLARYASRLALRDLRHARNQGLGPALRDCLLESVRLAAEDDIVVGMDADMSHDPALIPRMVELIGAGRDIVIASRYRPGAEVRGLAVHRRLISWAASMAFRVLFPIPGVRDYTCGFRAYRAEVLKRAFERFGDRFVDQQGFQCSVDILLKLRTMGLRMGETPMSLRYDLKRGSSKMRLAKTSLDTLRLIARRLRD
jgi:dolichol-phosphate mannosyltransferase